MSAPEDLVERIRLRLEDSFVGIGEVVSELQPADLADLLNQLTRQEAASVLAMLPVPRAVEVFDQPTLRRRSAILEKLDPGRAAQVLEGLSADGSHPLQKSWCSLDVAQCGYCQAGQIMSAAALLAKKPHPTDADIDESMAGNLCRCATYTRIRAGIHEAARLAAESAGKTSGAATLPATSASPQPQLQEAAK